MKYAIYDKAADAYLTTMDFDTEVPDNYTQYALGYNEYITKARLLDTKEEAADVVTRIESFKFMNKGRFVIHSFDDTLKDQYIISEAGNPTKVVESITVDLDGTINVKYGTMVSHWSATSLIYVINKLNKLQDASAPTRYCSWNATFDIYKVITVIDENGHNHYQFINVTKKGLENAKEEADPLNKRIEELEKANYELGEQVVERGAVANRLLDENNSLKTKVESIKKEARNWKRLYENASDDQKKLNDANKATIAYLTIKNMANDKELSDLKRCAVEAEKSLSNQLELSHGVCDENRKLRIERDCTASIIHAIRNAICEERHDAFNCLESRMKYDSDFNSDPFMAGVKENVKDICTAEKRNVANHDLKNSEIAKLTKERDKAIERAEFYKRQANSIYGMTVPTRCCGKQLTADILGGKKIPISKKKYDDLVEYVNNINLTYDNIFCMMDKPVYLSTITESLNELTK